MIQGAAIARRDRRSSPWTSFPRSSRRRGQLGATHTVDAATGDPTEAVRDLSGGGVDHAFEAIGRPATIELAIGLTGRGGQAILVGMAPPEARIPVDALTLTLEERAIRGCWYGSCRPLVDFPMLVDLYTSGKLKLDAMIETCDLDGVNDAFDAMKRGETARTVIVYPQPGA